MGNIVHCPIGNKILLPFFPPNGKKIFYLGSRIESQFYINGMQNIVIDFRLHYTCFQISKRPTREMTKK